MALGYPKYVEVALVDGTARQLLPANQFREEGWVQNRGSTDVVILERPMGDSNEPELAGDRGILLKPNEKFPIMSTGEVRVIGTVGGLIYACWAEV